MKSTQSNSEACKEWIAILDGASLGLMTPAGEVFFCSGRVGYVAAVERGDVAFSPLEMQALLKAIDDGVDFLADATGQRRENAAGSQLAAIVALKRADPAARLRSVILLEGGA